MCQPTLCHTLSRGKPPMRQSPEKGQCFPSGEIEHPEIAWLGHPPMNLGRMARPPLKADVE